MIYWAQLLHFYQPPTQMHAVLEKICDESYRPLIDVFRQHPQAKVTLNISGVLTEMLQDHGHRDIVEGLRQLAQQGQVEFTGSGKYHPILPLIPREEVRRQITLHRRTSRYFFGQAFNPRGFFPPELCYSADIVDPILDSDHEWVILSGMACPMEWPTDMIYEVEHEGRRLAVFFRDDILSNKISFQSVDAAGFVQELHHLLGAQENAYVVTAMDAETYGHHIQHWEKLFLAEVYEELVPRKETYAHIREAVVLANGQRRMLNGAQAATDIQSVTVSELLDLFPRRGPVVPKASSWGSTAEDLAANNPYPLWHDPENEIHQLQWEHLNLCLDMTRRAVAWANNEEGKIYADIARGLLDRAVHSCQFWWASRRPMWDINLIHRGIMEQWEALVNAYKAIRVSDVSPERKTDYYYRVVAARHLRNEIEDRLFLE